MCPRAISVFSLGSRARRCHRLLVLIESRPYAMLVKIYGPSPTGSQGRYSPAECTGIHKIAIEGRPDKAHVSTSYVGRQNLTMRMQMRRFTRLTSGFSKKFENHADMVALYTVWYNFVKLHKAHRMSPAMAVGVSDRLWSIEDITALVEAAAPVPGKRGPYKRASIKPCKS